MAYKTTTRSRHPRPLAGKDMLVARSSYSDLNGSQVLIARDGYGSQSDYVSVDGTLDDIVSTVKKIGSTGYDLLTGAAKAQGEAAAYQQMQQQNQGTPGWVLPVALGGVGLITAVLLLRRRSEGKRK